MAAIKSSKRVSSAAAAVREIPVENLSDQLQRERRLVSFDNYDITVKQLLDMRTAGSITVPPEYQRQFVWDEGRESVLVESVFLGIPVPNIFMATNDDATWEVVDGVQRLGTLAHFVGSKPLLAEVAKDSPLRIEGLEKLSQLNELLYTELPDSMRLMFETRPLRVTVLNDKSDMSVRFDLFERLNTGGISLTNQEIRNCIFRGRLNDEIKALASTLDFQSCIRLKPGDKSNGTAEEFVLRFFAFLEGYLEFDHSVKEFLNDYMKVRAKKSLRPESVTLFVCTFKFLNKALPHGIIRGARAITPVNLFEAIAVGAALAISTGRTPSEIKVKDMLNDSGLRQYTIGGTNNKRMVRGRIEHVRDNI